MPTVFRHCQRLSFGAVLSIAAMSATAALAQSLPVERNLPPQADTAPSAVTLGASPQTSTDGSPLGVTLRAVRLIGRDESPSKQAGDTVAIGSIGIGAVPETQLRSALLPYLNKPLSMALIAEAQAAIASVYREAGHPFVSVTTPPQEITGGTLNLRVIEYGFGAVTARGIEGASAAALAGQIRASEGARIEAPRVNEDLRWLNRYPYRRVQGVFSPGDGLGYSDLTLDVTSQKPWQIFTGYANTGTRETDRDRIFFGAGFGLPWLNDAYGSWQTTGSPDLFEDAARIFGPDDDRAQYLSHSARLVIPTFDRQALEISPSFVATRQEDGFFTFDNDVFELPVYYRSALSNILPGGYRGDVYAGVEFKRLTRGVAFDRIPIGSSDVNLFQIGLGWDNSYSDRLGSTDVSLIFKFNPSGIVSGNNDRDWNAFSNGRVENVNYAYLNGAITRQTPLAEGFSLRNELSFQLASDALPDTEQMTLGGLYAVRGYGLESAAIDSGFVLRNELHAPPGALAGKGVLSPFVFVDAGIGRDKGLGESAGLAGAGAGLHFAFGTNLSISMTAAFALADQARQDAGDFDLKLRIFASY